MNAKRIFLSLGMLVFVGAVVAGGTGAFFTDTETSAGNTFAAGAVDVEIDNIDHTDNNGEPGPDFTYNENGMNFDLEDLKPGDLGTIDYDLVNNGNPAFVCAMATETGNQDNGTNEAEEALEDDNSEGELQNFLSFRFGNDSATFDEDGSTGFFGERDEVDSDDTTSSSFQYCFGEFQSDGTCDGSSDENNIAQTDSTQIDLVFEAIQQRNNDGFTCGELNNDGNGDVQNPGDEDNTITDLEFDGPDNLTEGENGVFTATLVDADGEASTTQQAQTVDFSEVNGSGQFERFDPDTFADNCGGFFFGSATIDAGATSTKVCYSNNAQGDYTLEAETDRDGETLTGTADVTVGDGPVDPVIQNTTPEAGAEIEVDENGDFTFAADISDPQGQGDLQSPQVTVNEEGQFLPVNGPTDSTTLEDEDGDGRFEGTLNLNQFSDVENLEAIFSVNDQNQNNGRVVVPFTVADDESEELTTTMGTNFPGEGSINFVAEGRVGNSAGDADGADGTIEDNNVELLLGTSVITDGAFNSAQYDLGGDEARNFTLTYEAGSGVATLTVEDDGSNTQTVTYEVGSVSAGSDLFFIAKNDQDDGVTELTNLTLDGQSINASLRQDGSGDNIEFIKVSGSDLTNGFTATGDILLSGDNSGTEQIFQVQVRG